VRLRPIVLAMWAVVASAVHAAQQPASVPTAPPSAEQTPDFAADVQPILKASCFACHSGERPMAQLRLDVRSMAMKGGASGPIIVPGKRKDSPLMHRVLGTEGTRMPFGQPALSPEKIAVLSRWIDQGALWPEALANEQDATIKQHWAYVKPVMPPPPAVRDGAWIRTPIDRFVWARLEKEGLRPSPEAPRETLIRRLSLDLIGLPPSPADVDAFLADTRPDAYERVVERLLASPHYGERWANPWLDLARYGDSDGYEKDSPRVAWPYRDWVINAFNQNMPFDQFTIEQLAGDLLPNATNEQKIATGFVRASLLSTEGGVDPEEQNWVAQVDRASTLGTTFLGSTVACAQCHNHKYDPFKQTDFYSLVAFFNNATFVAGRGDRPSFREPTLDLATPAQAAARDTLNAEIRDVQAKIDQWPDAAKLRADWERSILAADSEWKVLVPTRLSSTNGSTLTADSEGAILAAGTVPDSDTYSVEATSPVAGRITGFRLEALTHDSLPKGGPGRDFYGNFSIQRVELAAGPSADRLSPVQIRTTLTDSPSAETNDTTIRVNLRQLWRVRVNAERLPRQLVLMPEAPLVVPPGSVLRVRLVQTSDIKGQILGRFRLSVTMSDTPDRIVGIPYNLRSMLAVPEAERRTVKRLATGNNAALGDTGVTEHWQSIAPELAALRGQLQELRRKVAALKIPTTLILSENPSVSHPSTQIRVRGDWTKRGAEVMAAVPGFLGALPAEGPQNRLGLARWLVSRDNPLTARVRVNHIWQTYFGRGIVQTSEDFGSQGTPPSHPELLDWLAVQFMDSGWDQKALHQLIVTSSTYRQASGVSRELLERDPANALLARGPRFRVEAEMVRDIALEASGLMSHKIGGPPVMPYQPDGVWLFPFQAADDQWVVSEGEDKYRRALYTFVRRTARYPSLMVFDAHSHEAVAARRPNSNTPLQALTTLNDPAFFEAAQAMARRVTREGGTDTMSRAVYGFRLATARPPRPAELQTLLTLFAREEAYFVEHRDEVAQVAGQPDPALAAWTMVSNMLLNLDATLTKE
jgi:mono/diheme cytochrome c family protein